MSKKENNFFKKYNFKWILSITIWTFLLAIVFSIITENLTTNLGLISSLIILLFIILLGIFFDIIGIAVTRAEEKPFHSMASKRINEAKIAIKLVRNADKVSNCCNDVIGDISGIISGAVGANLIYKLSNHYDLKTLGILSILITALTASLTVGGKAMGKSIALMYYEKIIYSLAEFLNFFEKNFNLVIFDKKQDKKRQNTRKK